MKQKTNGKIAIAILAMFAVALSIVGFTYAYFTATFNVNPEDKSVIVNAGKLVANFEGKSNIDFSGIVPGWISNGLSYYDSNIALSNEGNIFASELTLEATTDGDGNTIPATYTEYYGDGTNDPDPLVRLSYESKGLTQPIQFTVTNDKDSPDDVSFIIRLTNINNGIYTMARDRSADKMSEKVALTEDLPNLKVHLYEGVFDYAEKNNATKPYGGTHISTLVLGYNEDEDTDAYGEIYTITGTEGSKSVTALNAPLSIQNLSTAPHTLKKCAGAGTDPCDTADSKKNYFVMFEYSNIDALQIAQGASFGAKVEIIGIQKDNDSDVNKWYNADNEEVKFATSRS